MLRHVVLLLALFEPLGCAAEPSVAPAPVEAEPAATGLVAVPEALWARAVGLPTATLAALRDWARTSRSFSFVTTETDLTPAVPPRNA